ncbi:MAG: AAA family ATPase [Bacteroidia bacterium]
MKVTNPFLTSGYVSAEYFCDRELETEKLVNALQNGRNITLISLRRIGKTGLIHHVFYQLQQEKDVKCFYIDIMPTTNLADFIRQFSNAIIGKMDSAPEKTLKKIAAFFSGLRPVISYDPMTAQPSLEFALNTPQQAEATLAQLFAYLAQQKKHIIIALDEMQQIIHYPEKNTEALLRAHVQQTPNVNFIFSGSHKHLLLSMFSHHGRPFYQSTEVLQLGTISPEKYAQFIKEKFSKINVKISDEAIGWTLNWCRLHTWYVQYFFNKLYAEKIRYITEESAHTMAARILEENQTIYYTYRNLLTDYQWQLLSAIAKSETVKMPTSKAFINTYKLGSASSVKTALKALLDKEMIFLDEGNGYMVYDVFLSRWIERA